MFQFMFLQRLPVTLRTLLGEQEPGDIRSLAARADRLWATHRPQGHDLVAQVGAAEEQPAQVAAVQKKKPWSQPAGKKPWGRQQAAGGQAAVASGPRPARITHSEQARVGSGLCSAHWTYGARAHSHKCVAPCSWAGN
jgi:transcriptional regulator with AAA-type ATPase domain